MATTYQPEQKHFNILTFNNTLLPSLSLSLKWSTWVSFDLETCLDL